MSLALGIEIGGTKLQAAVSDREDRVLGLARGAVDVSLGAPGICRALVGLADQALANAGGTREALTSVGIGFGGPVDSRAGRVLCSHQVAGWGGFELAVWARSQWGVAALVQNDANAAAWAVARCSKSNPARRDAGGCARSAARRSNSELLPVSAWRMPTVSDRPAKT